MFRNGLKINMKIKKILKVEKYKLIYLFFILLFYGLMLTCCNHKIVKKDIQPVVTKEVQQYKCDSIEFYCDKNEELLGEMTVEQFTALVTNAEVFEKELEAEKTNRVIVVLKDDPWILIKNKTFKTSALISWLDKDQKPIKKMTIEINLKQDNSNQKSIWDIISSIYVNNIAPWGCAIGWLGFITCFLILIF